MICEGHLVCDDCHEGRSVATTVVHHPNGDVELVDVIQLGQPLESIRLEITIGETVKVKPC